MAFFVGSNEHSMDAKGRVSLPAAFRKEFGEGKTLVLAPGTDGEVNVFSQEAFEEWIDSLFDEGFNKANIDHVRRKKYYLTQAKPVEVDKAGRISIPPHLIESGKLDKTVLVNGEGDHVAIWNPDVLDAFMGGYEPGEIYRG